MGLPVESKPGTKNLLGQRRILRPAPSSGASCFPAALLSCPTGWYSPLCACLCGARTYGQATCQGLCQGKARRGGGGCSGASTAPMCTAALQVHRVHQEICADHLRLSSASLA